jgi:hypothetical protein
VLLIETFDAIRAGVLKDRSQFFKDLSVTGERRDERVSLT